MSPDRHDPHSLAPDDPRLSEWLDGRLTAAEAAEVERLVAASPELTRLVSDLRSMRRALGAVPVTPPPAGFVRDVLAAIDAAGAEAGDEDEVEEEWRRIERQRLEGEIAEARDDAAEPVAEPMRQRWPWLALAGALAAGVLVAVVINRPGGLVDREVALAHESLAVKRSPATRPADSADGEKQKAEVADTWLDEDADGAPTKARTLADIANLEKAAENAKALADRQAGPSGDAADRAAAHVGQSPTPQRPRREGQGGAAEPEVNSLAKGIPRGNSAADESAADKADGKPGGGKGGGGGADPGALASRVAPPAAAPGAPTAAAEPATAFDAGKVYDAAAEPRARTVTYRIRTPADRRRLDELVAASGGVQRRDFVAQLAARRRGKEAAAEAKSGAAAEAEEALREGGPATERIVLAGPADTLASLAAALAATPGRKAGSGVAQGAGGAADGLERKPPADVDQIGDAEALARLPAQAAQRGQAQVEQPAEKLRGTEALLVIEVVDETLAEAGEGRP